MTCTLLSVFTLLMALPSAASATISSWTPHANGGDGTTWGISNANWAGATGGGLAWDGTNGPLNEAKFSLGLGTAASITSTVTTNHVSFSPTGDMNFTPGTTSLTDGFTLTVSGSGRLAAAGTPGNGGLQIDNSDIPLAVGNKVVLTAPGSAGTPTWQTNGGSNQLRIGHYSDKNGLEVTNGAFFSGGGASGTLAWHIGGLAGADSNYILVSGTNSSLSRGTGSFVNVGEAGSSNSYRAENGGTIVGGRVGVGTNGGDDNYQLTTGTNSYFRLNGGTGTHFDVGQTAGSNGNSFRVGAGGRADVFGSGTTRRTGVGEVATADSNYIEVSGTGAQFNYLHNLPMVIGGNINNSALVITSGGDLNHIDVFNGGTLNMDNSAGTALPVGAPPANPNFTFGAAPAFGAALVLSGTNSSFNLGNGTAIATANIGSNANFFGVQLNGVGSIMNVNNGRLIAGPSNTTTMVSGIGLIDLDGTAYFSTPHSGSTISNKITGVGDFHKEGAGTLALTNISLLTPNNYTGDTYVDAGVLKLDSAPLDRDFLDDLSSVYLATGAKMNLNFAGSDTIAALYFNNVLQSSGTYGRVGSGATNENDTFFNNAFFPVGTFGGGILNVVAQPVETVPEPSTLALAALGLAGLGLFAWRRRKSA